jgi:hypothetical protein
MLNCSRLAYAAGAALLVLCGSASQAGGASGPVRIDLTASAQPQSAAGPTNTVAFRVSSPHDVSAHVATTATASSICSGCSGQAISVQVLYLDHAPAATLDNVAVAWDQKCTTCRATAVSVQVVMARGKGTLTPNNRALAVDASCAACAARAAAFQIVVTGPGQSPMSGAALRQLRAWAVDQARLLQQQPPPTASERPAVKARALDSLKQVVSAAAGTGHVAASARLAGH